MAVSDAIWNYARHFLGPGNKCVAITPHNSTDFPLCRAIYVGVGGNAVIVDMDGNEVMHKNLASGSVVPIRARRVNSTDLTASDLVAWY